MSIYSAARRKISVAHHHLKRFLGYDGNGDENGMEGVVRHRSGRSPYADPDKLFEYRRVQETVERMESSLNELEEEEEERRTADSH